MLDLTFTGAEVLRPEGLSNAPLALSEGRVVEHTVGRTVDLSGFRVLPGIVDAHGDGFERHLAPRRGAMKDLSQGLISAEAELAANGITTAMLAQFWSWEGGMRSKEFALRFLDTLQGYQAVGTDLRVQLRFEYALLEDYPSFLETVQKYAVGYVVFNDHLPHAALAKGKKPPRLTGQALKSGRSPEAHLELLKALHDRQEEADQAVAGLAADLAAQGVRLGSHDDDTAEARQSWQAREVAISEFPETRAAADSAAAGVVLGAPNVVRGGSHSGNVSAADLLREGIGDALASDYHYPAPKQAALLLAEELGLAAAWGLVSKRPAALLGLDDRGDLVPGKRADLVVLDEAGRIGATIAGGQVTHLSGAVAARFMA
ncbi:alpha-D-ribose 1-methylphosphonate 5-triphosphate diphosphatase [Thalassobius sp. MITS945101]|uniref:alpha-D-ribose 1-methylphosphonate 5-triphosphate diphosphatase n=1 Tax=Thalassobius sp. MITS945101 TaxID=3096994 RepID=UPI00399A6D54